MSKSDAFLRIARVTRPYRLGLGALIGVTLLVRWLALPNVVVVTPTRAEVREVWPMSTFHTGDLVVDNTATINGNVLDDNAGALRIAHDSAANGVQLQLFELGYSNPVTAVGGLVPASDTNPLLSNFGTKQGQGTSYNKYPVGFNGQTAPLYTIDVLSDEAHVTNTDWKIKIGWAGSSSFDTNAGCTVAPCEGAGVYSQANLTHASGTASLIAAGLHGRASLTGAGVLPGDRAYSIWGEDGLVRLDGATTIGLPTARVPMVVNTDASIFQGATTTAQAAATGTLVDLRQGAVHNYLGFSNPDATDAGIVINNVANSGDAYFIYRNSTGWQLGAQNQTIGTFTSGLATMLGPIRINGAGGETVYGGTGSPNGAQTGNPGDIYLNKSGGAGTSLYTKESGAATNTGWVAVSTGSSISGTMNTIPKFTSPNAVGDSLLTDNATTLAYATNKFTVVAASGDTLIAGNATIGAGAQIISGGAPGVNHGALSTGSTNFMGDITGIGANTSVVITYSAAFPNRSRCVATPTSSAVTIEQMIPTPTASNVTFTCFAITTGVPANCDDFTYTCVGQ